MYKLMVVDDEPLIRSYLKANITRLHPRWSFAAEAGDGREAADLLDGGVTADLVLTDIRMPVMDGLELVRYASGRYPDLQIAILSGYDEFPLAQEAMRYGVEHYLLKPLVNAELSAMLERVAEQLDARERDWQARRALAELSADTKRGVISHFLQAVVSDNNVEIKSLYPMLFRMKVELIEAEGAVLLLDLDEVQWLLRGLTPEDLSLYRYILRQTAAELAAEAADSEAGVAGGAGIAGIVGVAGIAGAAGKVRGPDGKAGIAGAVDGEAGIVGAADGETGIAGRTGMLAFVDAEQRTSILVTGEDESGIRAAAERLYGRIAEAMRMMTGLVVWGAIGSAEPHVLQLAASHRQAVKLMQRRLYTPEACLLGAAGAEDAAAAAVDADIRALVPIIAGIRSSAAERLEPALAGWLRAYAAALGEPMQARVLRFGIYLAERLIAGQPADGRDARPGVWRELQAYAAASQESANAEAAAAELYRRIAEVIAQVVQPSVAAEAPGGASGGGEPEAVARAKAYICEHYAEPLSLALIADRAGVSPNYLSHLFHQSEQESYIKYVTRIRMEHAARLLREKPAVKVYDVSERVGYVSVKHFSHVFKQYCGMPPGEYQERHAQQAP